MILCSKAPTPAPSPVSPPAIWKWYWCMVIWANIQCCCVQRRPHLPLLQWVPFFESCFWHTSFLITTICLYQPFKENKIICDSAMWLLLNKDNSLSHSKRMPFALFILIIHSQWYSIWPISGMLFYHLISLMAQTNSTLLPWSDLNSILIIYAQ